MAPYFSQVKKFVDDYVAHYRKNLDQDQKALRGFKGRLILGARSTGTNLLRFGGTYASSDCFRSSGVCVLSQRAIFHRGRWSGIALRLALSKLLRKGNGQNQTRNRVLSMSELQNRIVDRSTRRQDPPTNSRL